MPEELISALVDGLKGDPRRTTAVFFQHWAVLAAAPEEATAFANRYAMANMMAMSGWRHGEDPSDRIEVTRRYWSTLEKFTRGFYINDMSREVTAQDINANYRGNYTKLVALKTGHDPSNLFRFECQRAAGACLKRVNHRQRQLMFGNNNGTAEFYIDHLFVPRKLHSWNVDGRCNHCVRWFVY